MTSHRNGLCSAVLVSLVGVAVAGAAWPGPWLCGLAPGNPGPAASFPHSGQALTTGGELSACNASRDPWPEFPEDVDGDGVIDGWDNCPATPNADQADSDGDGVGDACEADCNGNGAPDDDDIATGLSVDCNNNEIPDECELVSSARPVIEPVEGGGTVTLRVVGSAHGAIPYWDEEFDMTRELTEPMSPGASLSVSGFAAGYDEYCAVWDGEQCLWWQQYISCVSQGWATYDVLDTAGAGVFAFRTSATVDGDCVAGNVSVAYVNLTLAVHDPALPPDTPLKLTVEVDVQQAYGATYLLELHSSVDELRLALLSNSGVLTALNGSTLTLALQQYAQYDSDVIVRLAVAADCNANGILDECDIAAGTSIDADGNGIPDECEAGQRGDLNCDGSINGYDIDPFVLALTDSAAYSAAFADCDYMLADINGDGAVNGYDIDPFVECLISGGCPELP